MTVPVGSLDALGSNVPQSEEAAVRYSYWPVSYQFGDPTVTSNAPLPLFGVKFTQVMRGVGMLRGFLQLNEPEVRELDPWSRVVPRKTGIVVVREQFDPEADQWVSAPVWHGIVWAAPRDPQSGRMEIMAQTVESLWGRRLITKAMSWSGQDQATIAADLLLPAQFSKVALGVGTWTGWINVDPPSGFTGVTRTWSYADGQETNLLEAHQARSQLATNPYEWTTGVRVLDGLDAVSANTFRVQYVLGFPRLGRSYAAGDAIDHLVFDREGSGNVSKFGYAYDGSNVPNIVWGRGNGYEELQVKTKVENLDTLGVPEWNYGFLQTEDRFSDPDVKVESTLIDYCVRHMRERLGSEQFITALTLRGDIPPYFGTYAIGDQQIVSTNDMTWQPDWYDTAGYVDLLTRTYGWTVTPPEGDRAETVELVISGGRAEL
jgi:hypothetical protein